MNTSFLVVDRISPHVKRPCGSGWGFAEGASPWHSDWGKRGDTCEKKGGRGHGVVMPWQ